MKPNTIKNLFICFLSMICTSCANQDIKLEAPTFPPEFVQQINPIPPFHIKTIARNKAEEKPLRVYIEGDGFAWVTRRRPSADPTPRNQLVMNLMAQDDSPNIAYMARPCQFTKKHDAACRNNDWWTNKRFHKDAVIAMNKALDTLKAAPSQKLELVGFSGGGAMAALLATSRDDVSLLITIAGNLDVHAVNKHHKVSAMPDSKNPIDSASKLAHTPQIHFYGTEDRVIPPFISARFIDAQDTDCARRIAVNAGHSSGWLKAWLNLLEQIDKDSLCHSS